MSGNFICIFLLFSFILEAQKDSQEYQIILNGLPATVQIINGDTLITTELEKAIVKPFHFNVDPKEQERYQKYMRYAAVVYPYAVHAVRLYNQVQVETAGWTPKQKRRFVKKISNTLEEEFEDPLKNLTKTQGFLLTKMIERELDKPFLDIVKELKGGFAAYFWNQIGKLNGYKLKNKYKAGEDELLDFVLEEYDLKKDLK